MPSYTISTGAREEAALTAVVAKRNAERAAPVKEGDEPLAPLTNTQYLESIVQSVLEKYVRETDADAEAAVANAYKTAPKAKRDAVKAALGM